MRPRRRQGGRVNVIGIHLRCFWCVHRPFLIPDSLILLLGVIQAGFEACPKSAFAHRVMAEAHLREVDYANAISVAEKGVSLTRAIEFETGKKMPS